MSRYVRQVVQVSLLSALLFFGAFLIVTGEGTVWSDNAYENHATYARHFHAVNNGEVDYYWIYEYGTPP